MAKTLEQQLAAAELKANALRAKLSKANRSADTRRKIVVGGMVLAHMQDDAGFAGMIRDLLKQKVVRPIDREAVADLIGTTGAAAPESNEHPSQQHAAE